MRNLSQVRTYMDQWQEFFVPKVLKKASLTAADYDRIPRFLFQEESESAITARVGTFLILLFVPVLLLSAVAMWRLRQFPVVG